MKITERTHYENKRRYECRKKHHLYTLYSIHLPADVPCFFSTILHLTFCTAYTNNNNEKRRRRKKNEACVFGAFFCSLGGKFRILLICFSFDSLDIYFHIFSMFGWFLFYLFFVFRLFFCSLIFFLLSFNLLNVGRTVANYDS